VHERRLTADPLASLPLGTSRWSGGDVTDHHPRDVLRARDLVAQRYRYSELTQLRHRGELQHLRCGAHVETPAADAVESLLQVGLERTQSAFNS